MFLDLSATEEIYSVPSIVENIQLLSDLSLAARKTTN
jgi:hypothetical protein